MAVNLTLDETVELVRQVCFEIIKVPPDMCNKKLLILAREKFNRALDLIEEHSNALSS